MINAFPRGISLKQLSLFVDNSRVDLGLQHVAGSDRGPVEVSDLQGPTEVTEDDAVSAHVLSELLGETAEGIRSRPKG